MLVSPYGTTWLLLDAYREIICWKYCTKHQIFITIEQRQVTLHEDFLTFVISRAL